MKTKTYESPELVLMEFIQEGMLCTSSLKFYQGTPGSVLDSDWYSDEL